jgi:hypothetical protein
VGFDYSLEIDFFDMEVFRIDWYTRLTLTDVSLTIKNQSRLLVDESFYLANIFLRSWPLLLYTHI